MEQPYRDPRTKQNPSFRALVQERFSDALRREVYRYLRTNRLLPAEIVLNRVLVTRITKEELYFCAVFRNVCRQETPLWDSVMAECVCPLKDAFTSVSVLRILSGSRDTEPVPVLPDDLVPVLPKTQLDLVAQQILASFYPRATRHAEAVSADILAEKLGLKILCCGPDPDPNLLGRIFFEDTSVLIRRLEDGEPQIRRIPGGTILVHTLHNGLIDRHLRNSTILHECVHWILHRPAFLLAKAFDPHAASAASRVRQSGSLPRARSSLDRMEWQADSLAPRLLMPAWSTRFVAESWLHRFDRLPPVLRMEHTIDKLSERFGVSRQLAMIRMIELGYEDAKSAFSYYAKKKHRIPFADALQAFSKDPALRQTLLSGAYAYVSGCFVLLDRKNVYRDEQGNLCLTPYAKANPDTVCLAFAARHAHTDSPFSLFRYRPDDEAFLSGSAVPVESQAKRTKAVQDILQKLPSGFSETLAAHMKRKCITNEQLAERCLMSDRQIYRFKSTLFPAITLRNAVNLCLGLRLHPLLSMDLIRKAGYSFNFSLEHMAYQFLLLSMSECSIYDCNAYLKSLGLKPLGKEE